MSIIQRVPWTVQPQVPVEINKSNPMVASLRLSEVYTPNLGLLAPTLIRKYNPVISSGTVVWGIGPKGRAVSFPNNEVSTGVKIAADSDSVFTSTTTASILVVRQSANTSVYGSWTTSFGYNVTISDRVLAHIPGTDGNVHFDFGTSGSSNRLSVAAPSKTTDIEVWCFVAGPTKGREIWRNGVNLAKDPAKTGSRPTTSQGLFVGAVPLGACDKESVYLFAVGIAEWSDSTISKISNNPWQIFTPQTRRIWAPSAAAPGGFQAAWARNRSHVIGAGAR